jgi:hypothetical protein
MRDGLPEGQNCGSAKKDGWIPDVADQRTLVLSIEGRIE